MSCLFPGADSPEAFWQNLIDGRNSTSDATADEFGADPTIYFDPQRRTHDTTYSLRGGYVRHPIDIPEGMSKASAWTIHVISAALSQSGYADREELLARCGLILGNLSFPTQESHRRVANLHDSALEQAIGELLGVDDFSLPRADSALDSAVVLDSPAAVAAQTFGLKGAYFCLDAACASSLYAVGLACAYLAAGKADLMLAGAVSAADPLFVNMGFTHFGAYPEQGESRPLDKDSGGLISGEGAGMLVIRRYEDALRDGNEILAVIAGIGLSNDGKGKHPLTPNPRGQILAFQRAYNNGIDPASVQYIECHASGTPLGDTTELNSMSEFFNGTSPAPLIGSVKANNGHLLTAAGLASIIKVILAMQHGQIPATIGVHNPLSSTRFGAAQIVTQTTPWLAAEKTAGINAFGFGGVSAHLVLQNPAAAASQATSAGAAILPKPMAIVGMDVQVGGCEGLESFAQTIYDGTQHFSTLPPKRWKGLRETAPLGAYIESFEADFLRFKFPPKEEDQPTPQHLLLLKVADRAVQDAALQDDSNVAVIVALGTELSLHRYRSRLDLSHQVRAGLQRAGISLSAQDESALADAARSAISPAVQVNQYTSYIGNIVSSRVSALWNFSGPAFTTSSAENAIFKALEIAQIMLADDMLEAVVIGAVDFAGGPEFVDVLRTRYPLNDGSLTLSFDQHANGWQIGEGAGAIVLKRADKAAPGSTYAVIESVAVVAGEDGHAVIRAGQQALTSAGVGADQIGYVEASASGIAAQDDAEIAGLNQLYPSPADSPSIALGSVKANIGHTGAAAGLMSLIKTALCISRRFVPAVPNWTAPKHMDVWGHASRFYVPQRSRTWFMPAGGTRYAAVSGLSTDGTTAHVILSDHGVERPHEPASSYLKHKHFFLFPIDADDRDSLLRKLSQLDHALTGDVPLNVLAARMHTAFRNGRFAAAIVGKDRVSLRHEIQLALKGIPQAFESGEDWKTPAGSAFSPVPLGSAGKVAFVYPGAFNSYPSLGQDWLHLFPAAYDYIAKIASSPGAQVADELLYPRALSAPGRAEIRAQRARLLDDQTAMMESGTSFALLYTHVIREIFRLQPSMAFGYSLGEGSMLWAMDVWRDSDAASATLRQSDLFRTRLVGRKDAVREAWGLPSQADDDFWVSYILNASAGVVTDAIAHETHVYLTHINTPSEVVIAGEPTACDRVIERLGCTAVRAPFENVIHNEVIMSEYDAFYHLHHSRVYSTDQNVTFYSAADYEPLRLERDFIARSIARVSCKQVDFPRLIQRAYRDGARIFVELGPGSTCTRWINDTLHASDSPHLAVSIDNLRLDDHTALIKMLARLVSHRVPIDLSSLYQDDLAFSDSRNLVRTITLGGEPVRDVILSEENRLRFARTRAQRSGSPVAIAQAAPVAVLEPPTATLDAARIDAQPVGHDALLNTRLATLRQIGDSLREQFSQPAGAVTSEAQISPAPAPVKTRYQGRPAVFDTASIDQFARGSIKACFGDEYAIYDHRRAPRIPNTDLMLLSRIVEVNAQRLVTNTGSSMTAEYDVPPDMWFYRDNAWPFTPYSMLMEMALQPCGFLSAYMGPTLDFPEIDFYFRNLDGSGKLLREVDLRGRTLVNRVELLSSTILQGIIIQKYSFEMMLDGEPFYVGSSTFGYFTLQALSSQAGLDMGKARQKWHEADPSSRLTQQPGNRQQPAHHSVSLALPREQLAFLDTVEIDLNGGTQGRGYIHATTRVHPSDWFFACHFHDDPVMPGSLGLEAISQAIQAYALEANLGAGMRQPRFGHVEDHEMVWKYRGQVLGDSDSVTVEISITGVERSTDRVNITADASVWKGPLRIYEFKNVGVSIREAD